MPFLRWPVRTKRFVLISACLFLGPIVLLIGFRSGLSSETRQVQTEPVVESDREGAIRTWEQYVECKQKGEFSDCFSLLSDKALETWADLYEVRTKEDYDNVKSAEESSWGKLEIMGIRELGESFVITADVEVFGEAQGRVNRDFHLIKQHNEWRVDDITDDKTSYLP